LEGRKEKEEVRILPIKYISFEGEPNDFSSWEELVKLNQKIFGPESRLQKASEKGKILIMAAYSGEKLVGYKIGYPEDRVTFYSWMGGVDPDYRGQGIARELMCRQHNWCRKNGFLEVVTKTQNRWRGMLMLNLSFGFDIIGCHIDRRGELKILMSKKVADNNCREEKTNNEVI